MPRIVRILGSLVGTVAAYLLYAAIAVPLIEPTAAKRSPGGTQPPAPGEHELPSTSQRFASLFKAEDWERDQPVVLVGGNTALLLKEYEPQTDGRLLIRPCTIVMLADRGDESESQRLREAVVLQAAEAVLQFDRPLDLGQGQIGDLHLVAGQLIGEIVIRSDQKEEGPQDDLHIATRDLQLQGDRILGSNPVQFRLGMHSGRGTELVVHLAPGPATKSGPSRGMSVGGVKSFELRRDVEMYLLVKSGGFLPHAKDQPAPESPPPAPGPEPAPCPLIITCQGPFTFDREQLTATFERQVDVVSQPAAGVNDRLRNCDRLVMQFTSAEDSPASKEQPAARQPARLSKLKPSRLEATGNAVVIEAPSHELSAYGQKLVFEAGSDTIELSGEREAMLRKGTTEVHAQTIRFQRAGDGALGRMLASGKGWLAADVQDGPAAGDQRGPQRMTARWTNRLQIAEDPEDAKFQVISVLGDARVDFAAMGGIDAGEIYVWLFEPPSSPELQPVSLPGSKNQLNLLPDRMQARGNVHLDSESLQGNVDELQAWFKFIPQPSTLNAQPSTTPAHSAVYQLPSPQEQPPAPEELPPPKQQKRRFDVAGRLLQVELAVRGKEASPSRVVLDGRAELAGTATKPGDKPLKVVGQRIEANQAGDSQAVVVVTGRPPDPQNLNDRGQPAEVEINGLKLTGDNVHLDQAANRVWIEGPGVLTLDTAGVKGQGPGVGGSGIEGGAPLYIRWQGGMNFDGIKARFETSVVAEQGEQWLSAPSAMDAIFTQPVNFADENAAARPEIDRVICYGRVELRRKSYDEQRQPAFEQLETGKLVLNQLTGELQADGPGKLVRVWLGTATALPGMAPGAPASARSAPPRQPQRTPQLNFLSVKFERLLQGRFPQPGQRRAGPAQITFSDRVVTAYGPVSKWDEMVQPDGLLENQFTLSSDTLTVRQMDTPAGGEPNIELEANGATRIEGQEFFATGQRVTYTKAKDLLVLQGDGYSAAELYHQRAGVTGAPTAAAREIKFWISSNTVLSDGTRVLNLNQMPGSTKR